MPRWPRSLPLPRRCTPTYGVFVRLLAYTGLRWGEATALRVLDVDLRRGRLDVRRAFSDVGGRLIEGTPKTHQGRTVPIAASVRADLAPLLLRAAPRPAGVHHPGRDPAADVQLPAQGLDAGHDSLPG